MADFAKIIIAAGFCKKRFLFSLLIFFALDHDQGGVQVVEGVFGYNSEPGGEVIGRNDGVWTAHSRPRLGDPEQASSGLFGKVYSMLPTILPKRERKEVGREHRVEQWEQPAYLDRADSYRLASQEIDADDFLALERTKENAKAFLRLSPWPQGVIWEDAYKKIIPVRNEEGKIPSWQYFYKPIRFLGSGGNASAGLVRNQAGGDMTPYVLKRSFQGNHDDKFVTWGDFVRNSNYVDRARIASAILECNWARIIASYGGPASNLFMKCLNTNMPIFGAAEEVVESQFRDVLKWVKEQKEVPLLKAEELQELGDPRLPGNGAEMNRALRIKVLRDGISWDSEDTVYPEKDEDVLFTVLSYGGNDMDSNAFRVASEDYDVLKSVLIQTMEALAFLSEKEILHADIKPGNIVMRMTTEEDAKPIVNMVDFGGMRHYGTSPRDLTYTPGYAPPEYFHYQPFGYNPTYPSSYDMFSMAVTWSTIILSYDFTDPYCVIDEYSKTFDMDFARFYKHTGANGSEFLKFVKTKLPVEWTRIELLEKLEKDIPGFLQIWWEMFSPEPSERPLANRVLQVLKKALPEEEEDDLITKSISRSKLLRSQSTFMRGKPENVGEVDETEYAEPVLISSRSDDDDYVLFGTEVTGEETEDHDDVAAERTSEISTKRRQLQMYEGDSSMQPMDRQRVESVGPEE